MTNHSFQFLLLTSLLTIGCGNDPIMEVDEPTCSSTDGRTACRGDFCEANTFCDAIICFAGCQSSANCAAGELCDKRGTTGVDEAGVCRPCNATPFDAGPGPDVPQAMDAGPSCADVSGNYTLSERPGNPGACSMLEVPPSGISVSQSGTMATWTYADGDSVETLWTCDLDSVDCVCSGTFTLQGVTGNVTWMPNAEEISATAMGLTCNFNARAQ